MRGDQIYPAGILRLGDIITCFPFEDPCIMLRVTGAAVLAALENSVSKLPALEGRFCQVSGLEFGYNPTRISGDRVRWAKVQGEELDLGKKYTVATRGYMGRGKDGFESLNVNNDDVEELIDEEHGILILTIIRQYFLSLKIMSTWKRGACISSLFAGLHKQQADDWELTPHPVEKRNQGRGIETSDEEDEVIEKECSSHMRSKFNSDEEKRLFEIKKRVARKWEMLAKVGQNTRNGKENTGVDWCRGVHPKVEGRINIVSS